MRKIKTVANWFLRLFLLFISFTGIMVFIFLFRPEYFIDDIELIIKNKLPNSSDRELNIGSINGNFATGFRVNQVDYSKDSTIIFSAKEIYIDPDLSRIAFGAIAFSEVIITSMYFNFQSSQLDGIEYNGKPTISFLNTEIASLIIDDGLFVIMDQLYKLNAELVLNYSNVVELDINSLNIHSPVFQDVLVFQSGKLIYNNEEIELSNIIINSHWMSGKADIIVNIEDFQKSSANIEIDKFFLELMNGAPINIDTLNIEIYSNNRILKGVLKCDADFQNRKYTDISISGIINKNIIEFDKASLIVDGQHISSTGLINIFEKSWEVTANIDEFELTKNTLISGEVNLNSDFNLDHFNGNILLINSLIDSVEISSISGQFTYNDGILSSDNISVESEGQISNFNIDSFADTDNFNIYSNIKLRDFSDQSFISKYALDSLNGDINISWIKNFDVNTIDLDINLGNGLLYENKFNGFNGNIAGKIVNGDFKGSSSGKLIGWEFYTYNWDIINYSIDILKDKQSKYQFNAISAMGDSIYISAEKEPEGDLFISECAGTLKQNKLNIQPFYANKRDDYYHFPKILINLGESKMELDGNYQNNNKYDISGKIENLELNNLYSIIGKTSRINGLIKFSTIDIDNNNQINPIYSATINMKDGAIDDIQFDQLNMRSIYQNRRLLIDSLTVDTHLGNINGFGWLNIGISDKIGLFQNEDKFNMNFTYKNVNIEQFNRYLPWGYESRGFMTGSIDLKGTVTKPEIISYMDISKPGFDKIDVEDTLSGIFEFKDNKLGLNLSLQTKHGQYSGIGSIPLDLNLIIENRVDISKEPIDFIFIGITNNFEFLSPYFDILDSLTTTPAKDRNKDLTDGCDLPDFNLYLASDGAVYYRSSREIASFQFNVDGTKIDGTYGGAAQDAGFSVSVGDSNLEAFSYTGATIPAGCGTLVNLSLSGEGTGLSKIDVSNRIGDSIPFMHYDFYTYSIKLILTGTLKKPVRNGSIEIGNSSLYLDPIENPIENIEGTILINNNQLIFDDDSTHSTKITGLLYKEDENSIMNLPFISNIKTFFLSEDLIIKNNLDVSGIIDITDFFNPKFALNLHGEDILISSSYDLFYGSGSADINVTGRDTMYISGEFIPTPYNFTIINLGDDESIDESKNHTGRIIAYDIHIPIKDGIKVETDNVNLLFDGDVNITKIGDENYNFTGKANIIDGKFYDNQGNIFKNTSGNILLTPTDNTPYIDLHAQTTIENNIIDVSFVGFADNPSLIFTPENDDIKYTQTEILQILTFGNVEGISDPDQTGNMLSNYVENEIEKTITRYSTLDEFQLTSQGSLLENIEGKEDLELRLIVGTQLSNKIYLNTELDLNDIENSQYEATYRINQNTSIVGGLNENNLWHLSYRIKFYYK